MRRNELLSGASEDDALGLIAQRTRGLTASDATLLVLGPDPPDDDFVVRAQDRPEELSHRRLDGRDPLLREVVESRTAVLAG